MSDQGQSKKIVQGLLFGVAFGFLLQKGGVAKYDVLLGALRLIDPTVFQVILAAIAVGMVGVWALDRAGLIEPQPKPTRYAANVLGGLIFGVGFAVAGYCPGTSAAALGQGNLDALAVIAGMIAGSLVYAEASGWLGRTVESLGDRGTLTLPQLAHVGTGRFVLAGALAIGLILVALEHADRRGELSSQANPPAGATELDERSG